jgi:hypothetical protein
VDFVKAEARKANDPTYGKSAMNYSQRDQKPQDMIVVMKYCWMLA